MDTGASAPHPASPDHPCCQNSGRIVVGVDEVGLGSLIGCVTSAAVILDAYIPGLSDSKAISAKKRDALAPRIIGECRHAIAHATLQEIDRIGIHNATMLAMRRAIAILSPPDDVLIIVDGIKVPENMDYEIVAIPKADASCPTVSAASIIAKVTRDAIIDGLADDDDPYAWRANKGYGTKAHIAAIWKHGPSIHHRADFAPVKQMLRGKIS